MDQKLSILFSSAHAVLDHVLYPPATKGYNLTWRGGLRLWDRRRIACCVVFNLTCSAICARQRIRVPERDNRDSLSMCRNTGEAHNIATQWRTPRSARFVSELRKCPWLLALFVFVSTPSPALTRFPPVPTAIMTFAGPSAGAGSQANEMAASRTSASPTFGGPIENPNKGVGSCYGTS